LKAASDAYDEDALARAISMLASQNQRNSYWPITLLLLRMAGWQIDKERVQGVWRREGLKAAGDRCRRRDYKAGNPIMTTCHPSDGEIENWLW
jgi:hypothetical protein